VAGLRNRFLLSVMVFLSGFAAVWGRAQDAEKGPTGPRVRFDSFVNENYRHLPALHGWQNTRAVMASSLAGWFLILEQGQAVTDGTPDQLADFLKKLPGAKDCDISVVYLASQQSARGDWEFVGKERCNWSDLLRESKIPPHPSRIVVMDSCYARVVGDMEGWEKLATLSLFAASGDERAWELDLSTKVPIDFRRRYPGAWAWSRRRLPEDWDGRISFLGLMWMEACAGWKEAPVTITEWERFFGRCEELAHRFRELHGRRWFSTLSDCRRTGRDMRK